MAVNKDIEQLNLLNCNNALELSRLKKQAKLKEADGNTVSRSDKDLLFDNLITVEELAVIFRLAPQTIRNWVAQGKLPYIKIGRRNLFLTRSLQEWLNRKEKSQWQ